MLTLVNFIVCCPRTGRACSEGACRERHWCRQLCERGLSQRGLPLKRKFRPRCCAKTRAGAPCITRVVPESGAVGFTAGCPPDLNEGWSRPDRRSNSDGVFDHAMLGVVRFRVTPHDARTRVLVAKASQSRPPGREGPRRRAVRYRLRKCPAERQSFF